MEDVNKLTVINPGRNTILKNLAYINEEENKDTTTSSTTLPITKISIEAVSNNTPDLTLRSINSKQLDNNELEGNLEDNEAKPRKDRMGTVIDKIIKKHRVTFRDAITERNVADVVVVENYKKYNTIIMTDDDDICECLLL